MVFLLKAGNGCPRAVQKVARTLQDLLTVSTPQIVVTEHDDGLGAQIKAEYPLTARVEAVAVDECEDSLRLCHGFARYKSRHPTPEALRLREGTETGSAGFPI